MCLPCGDRFRWKERLARVYKAARKIVPFGRSRASPAPNVSNQPSSLPLRPKSPDPEVAKFESASDPRIPIEEKTPGPSETKVPMIPTPSAELRPDPNVNLLIKSQDSVAGTDTWQRPNAEALMGYLASVFQDVQLYKRLVRSRGKNAQTLIDTFQKLLDSPGISLGANFRRNLIVAAQRLTKTSGLYSTSIVLRDIKLVDELAIAGGGTSDIYQGRLLDQVVCLKVIRVYKGRHSQWFLTRFASESILWGQLSHTNIMPFYGVYLSNNRFGLVSPWMSNGDINNYLRLHPTVNRKLLALDVASGLRYLHQHDLIHGDLRGSNILVDDAGFARVADFGLSAVADSDIPIWTSVSSPRSTGGTIRWQAPELLDVEADEAVQNTKASDVYALGCTLYEIFSGNVPFVELRRNALVISRTSTGSRPTRPSPFSQAWSTWGLTEAIWSLIEACWSADPQTRPTIDKIVASESLHHPKDDRSHNVSPMYSPSYFRDRSIAKATFPSVADIEALLDVVNMKDHPLVEPPLLLNRDAQGIEPPAQASFPGTASEPTIPGEPLDTPPTPPAMTQEAQRGLGENMQRPSSPTISQYEARITTAEEGAHEQLKGLVPQLDSIFNDIEKYKQLLLFRQFEAQKILDTFQLLLDSPGLSLEFRKHLLVATQRVSSSASLYPAGYNLEGVDSVKAQFMTDGGSAEIHKAHLFNHDVCLKVMRRRRTTDMVTLLKQFSSEAILWGQMSHPNLLPIYGVCQYSARHCLVSPWMENGDINEFLQKHPDANRKLLVLDAASGVAYLHEHDVIHGDLKGANVLVDNSFRARVGDFGLSAISGTDIVHWSSRSFPTSKGGTFRWQAPELLDHERDEEVHNSKATDIYALTCVIYEILADKLPFFEQSLAPTVIARVQAGAKPSRPPASSSAWKTWGLTESLWSLMQAGWSGNPSDRPTIHQILAHDELQSLPDDRPTNNLSSARFRDSIYAQSRLPSIDEIESLLNGILSGSPS